MGKPGINIVMRLACVAALVARFAILSSGLSNLPSYSGFGKYKKNSPGSVPAIMTLFSLEL